MVWYFSIQNKLPAPKGKSIQTREKGQDSLVTYEPIDLKTREEIERDICNWFPICVCFVVANGTITSLTCSLFLDEGQIDSILMSSYFQMAMKELVNISTKQKIVYLFT